MKKIPLALSLIASSILPFAIQAEDTIKYTTQNPAYHLEDKTVLGRLEQIYFTSNPEYAHIPFDAKIDTGADTTSMHAKNIHLHSLNPKYSGKVDTELLKEVVEEYGGTKSNRWRDEYNNEENQIMVSFDIRNHDTGDLLSLEMPLSRISVVKSRTSEEPLYRPVVKTKMKIGDIEVESETSLTNRENFSTPVLIGKTFLKDNAWVFAGYDYLQEQPKAQVIGRSETMLVDELPMDVSFSLTSKYSVMHATDIKVNESKHEVSFTTTDKEGNAKDMTLPLAGYVSFGKTKRPEVYIQAKGKESFDKKLLVYLKDRSKNSTQLRLGKEVLSKHFVISANEKNLLDKPAELFKDRVAKKRPLVVSPEELISVDGIKIEAKPDFGVQTPVLKVSGFEITSADKGEQVTYYLTGENGRSKKYIKPIIKKIRVGKSVRPVVEVKLEAGGSFADYDVALEAFNKGEEPIPELLIGRKASKNGVLVNTRAELLLQSHDLVKAGYIEKAIVEGLIFPVKLDTGADVSSINAQNIELFKEDGKDMVRFVYENSQGQKKEFTREVVRMMTIKAKQGEKPNHRPVVKMDVQIGDIRETVKVNLQDRSRFEYSMILGENFLRHGVVVSSDTTFMLGK
ncbi:RimK/LysX family protein [Vibrio hannami]|uniref:ATP-dependent zinc protease family protein n=1 Tax=Vibrio hannami TaxID=2717094 RepID=UPI00240EBB3B|nr:RimK/LysX family protein [Vibrio hannami]MDG3086869.1 RimK/LysX family protein [Vibrio hannami]